VSDGDGVLRVADWAVILTGWPAGRWRWRWRWRWRHSRFRGSKKRCHGNHVLAFCIWGAHWRLLTNTTKLSLCGGDAALCQITLEHLLDMVPFDRLETNFC